MDIKSIIKEMTIQINTAKKYGFELDSSSWGMEEGVIITVNQAQALIEEINRLHALTNSHTSKDGTRKV